MILADIRMKVLPEKHLELSQTIAILIGSIRIEKGAGAVTIVRMWITKMTFVFLRNGIPERAL